jgi:hypothetical protein
MKSNAARRAGGIATGALHGTHPHPGLGLVPAAGAVMWDDFIKGAGEVVASRYGDQLWPATTIGGTPATIASVAPGDWTETGVLSLTTPASSGTGSVLAFSATASLYRIPPPGSIFACKVRMTTGTGNYELWSGFASAAARCDTADATQFVGIRSVGGNLFGVVKNGAASETTVDLGYDCESSTWRAVGFEVGGTTAAPSVQFFILDEHASVREVFDRENVGSAITATMPSTTLLPVAIGLVTSNANDKAAQIDFWSWGGRTARG